MTFASIVNVFIKQGKLHEFVEILCSQESTQVI